jgi:hypothetical protein
MQYYTNSSVSDSIIIMILGKESRQKDSPANKSSIELNLQGGPHYNQPITVEESPGGKETGNQY